MIKKTRFKISTIEIILLMFSLVQVSIVPDDFFLIYRYGVITFLLLKYFPELNKNKIIVGLLFLYTIILSLSTWDNTHSITWMISACMLGMQYITFFCTFSQFVRKRTAKELISIIILFLLILLFVNDVLLVAIPYDFNNPDEIYLVGNKFLVSYYHSFLGCLVYSQYNNKQKRSFTFILYNIFVIFVNKRVNCTTGIIMSITIILMAHFPNTIKKILTYPKTFLASLCIENILIWSGVAIFTHPFVVYLITNVFHKSANMTGRLQLYSITLDLVKNKPLFGYGHLTNIYRNTVGYGNAQNGLFHIVTQAGIIGAIVYFSMVYCGLKKGNAKYDSYGIIMYIYGMLVASAIEISLSTQFIIAIAIIYAINKSQKES